MSEYLISRRVVAGVVAAGLVIGGSLIAAAPAMADATIRVATTGDDTTGNGSLATPYKTIQKAVDVSSNGDTISVGDGTFAGATVDKDVTVSGSGATNINSEVHLAAGAEGATLTTLHFTSDATQVVVDGLDGTPTTTIANNVFEFPSVGAQPNSIQIGSGAGLQIVGNTFTAENFTGDTSVLNVVSVNIIGHPTELIKDINITGNISAGYTNFVVAVGNGDLGIKNLTIHDNEASGTEGSAAIYLSERLENVDITGNRLHDNGGGVRFTLYNGGSDPVYSGVGPDIDVTGNIFADNLRGLRVEQSSVDDDVTATNNVFVGNVDYAISNESTGATVTATNSSWSTGTPATSGTDAYIGDVVVSPFAAEPPFTEPTTSAGAAANQVPSSSSNTPGTNVTTVTLPAAYKKTYLAVWGYSTKTFFGWIRTDSSSQFQVTWPTPTPVLYGNHQLALLSTNGVLKGFVGVTGVAETAFTTAPVPGISGTVKVGRTLTAIDRTWAPAGTTLTHQWRANNIDIVGATGSTLVIGPSLAGKKISLAVTATKTAYTTTTRVSPQTAAVAKGDLVTHKPSVSGSHAVESTLTASVAAWGPGSVDLAFKWQRDGVSIPGANDDTYKQVAADLGHVIRVRVTGSAPGYNTVATFSTGTTKTKPKLVSVPDSIDIGPSATVGTKLRIDETGDYSAGATLTYGWKVDGNVVGTQSTFTPRAIDIGKTVKVTVTASKTGRTPAKITSNTTTAVIRGTFTSAPNPVVVGAQVGSPSTVNLGNWEPNPTSYSYQWTDNGVDIPGANKSTFTPGAGFVAAPHELGVKVKGVRAGFNLVIKTSLTGKTVIKGVFKSTKPKITGTVKVGKTLTATATGWTGSPTFHYQWLLDGVAIGGAVDKTYRISSEDIGGRLSVTVTGTRGGFTDKSETSNETAIVKN